MLHLTHGIGVRPGEIFVGEIVDHLGAEAAFVVEHVMRDPQPVAHRARVADVAPGAARSGAPHRLAMIVELERDADRLGAAARGERGHHRTVDPARHGDDDSPLCQRLRKLEITRVHRGAP